MRVHRRVFAVIVALLLTGAGAAQADNLCLVISPEDWLHTVDCDPVNPQAYAAGYVGYSTTAADSCTNDDCNPQMTDCYCLNYATAWRISASDTDPYLNQGPLTDTLYLWLTCVSFHGVEVFAADFGLGGTMNVVAFEPMNGFTNAGTATHLQLLPGGRVLRVRSRREDHRGHFHVRR